MPYVVTDTVVSLRSVSAGVAQAGLPYFTVWPQTPRERLGPRRGLGVHLHNSGRGGSDNLIYIHGPTAPPVSVVTAF